jgi:hypothetical protein
MSTPPAGPVTDPTLPLATKKVSARPIHVRAGPSSPSIGSGAPGEASAGRTSRTWMYCGQFPKLWWMAIRIRSAPFEAIDAELSHRGAGH